MKLVRLSIPAILAFFLLSGTIASRGIEGYVKPSVAGDGFAAGLPEDFQHVSVHDGGNLYEAFYDGHFSIGYISGTVIDPETSQAVKYTQFPNGSNLQYMFFGGIWVGGIVNDDTLVSTVNDGWYYQQEIKPYSIITGGTVRTDEFADDEFTTVLTDRLLNYNPTPLMVDIIQKTYSWNTPGFDNFILVNYTIRNIDTSTITDGWAGIFIDSDVHHSGNSTLGANDDCSGVIDTMLDELDPSSQTLIAYSFDNDGDPGGTPSAWQSTSPRGAISLSLLGSDFEAEHLNFNWWVSNSTITYDFGPRRADIPEDPFRTFSNGALGTPGNDGDRYYMLSHPEVDYNQMFIGADFSGEGWLSPPASAYGQDFANGYDTRFLLSFGPFDLPPGDSVSFTVALVSGDHVHTNAADYATYYDYTNPYIYYNTLDFDEVIQNHQIARDVYLRGFKLPPPGPPEALSIFDFDDLYVELAWQPVDRSEVVGYNVYYRDMDGDAVWTQSNPMLVSDTSYVVPIAEPGHLYELAVTTIDDESNESDYSESVSIVTFGPCGDADGDDATNIGDAVFLVRYVFSGGPPPPSEARADVNCDGSVNIGDAVGIVNHIFRQAELHCCP